jgi:hypothetical protein
MTAIILYDVGVSSGLPSWHSGFHAGLQINAHYIGMLQLCGSELLYRCNYKSNPLCIKPQRLPAMQFDISLTMCTWAGYWLNWRRLLVAGQSKFCNYTPYSHTIILSTVGCCSRQHSNLRHITAPFFNWNFQLKLCLLSSVLQTSPWHPVQTNKLYTRGGGGIRHCMQSRCNTQKAKVDLLSFFYPRDLYCRGYFI